MGKKSNKFLNQKRINFAILPQKFIEESKITDKRQIQKLFMRNHMCFKKNNSKKSTHWGAERNWKKETKNAWGMRRHLTVLLMNKMFHKWVRVVRITTFRFLLNCQATIPNPFIKNQPNHQLWKEYQAGI